MMIICLVGVGGVCYTSQCVLGKGGQKGEGTVLLDARGHAEEEEEITSFQPHQAD